MPKVHQRKIKQQASYDGNKKGSNSDKERTSSDQEQTEESYTCSKCGKSVDQVIECECCMLWFCCKCQNVSEDMMSALNEHI